MDSYNFHFERMSNLDLHPLSLPVSRLSPAKSSSSIVDQLTHHQHGKGDSAYSSFSGGSTAQDYPSPFLGDDLQPCSLHHYTDFKYVKAIYPPTQVLRSDSKTMDQLYRSVEAISQQCRHNNNNNVSNHNHNGASHGKKKPLSNQEVPPAAPPPPALHPPPPPARVDSFIATRNLENSWFHQQGEESQSHQAQPQPQQPRPLSEIHPESQNVPKPQMKRPDSDRSLYGAWRGQHQQPQPPPVYRPHLQMQKPENPSITDDKADCEPQPQQTSANVFSHSPPRGRSLTELQKHKQPASSDGNNENRFERQRKRAHSANDCLVTEPTRAPSPWNVSQNLVNSSIQHKGQFYFVTGLCQPNDSGARTRSVSSCVSEAGSDSSTVVETYTLGENEKEKQRCHNTMEHLFRPAQQRPHKSNDMISNEREAFTSVAQEKALLSRSPDENCVAESREVGRHTLNHPIFYCGPEENCTPACTMQMKISPAVSREQLDLQEREDQAKRGRSHPLGDLASERINKETTPLLYHLTGASRAALNPKKDIDFQKGKEVKNSQKAVTVSSNERSPLEAIKQDSVEIISHACNTLDDSFKKYYKEKLKDAQCKVLRETSFKRKDLQLSWPHRIRQRPELRPTVIHSFSSSQDSEASTDTLTPSITSAETERGSVKEDERDQDKEKESGRPVNVAQPQVARIGGRKRLTSEQKKLCYSEPEKLNTLGDTPQHSPCRSLGNEADNVFTVEHEREEPGQQGEQGLVASRRKMFETRGRALSTSSLSKTNLKHIQHKALVEYMERKTGQKVAEPQKPGPQLPPPSRQRLSLGEKPFDLGHKPQPENTGNKTPKKKLTRPHSAGRILDSSNSSIRYAQFFSVHTGSVHCGSQPRQPNWQENQAPSQGKCASVENLLDQAEPPCFFRNRSTSIPHEFQAHDLEKDTSPVKAKETCSLQKNTEEESEQMGQQPVRVIAQRGKSMEELGASNFTRPTPLSKSSEQLDQLRSHTKAYERENKNAFGEGRGRSVWERVRERKDLWGLVHARPGLEPVCREESPAQGRPQSQVRSLSKQDLAALLVSEGEAGLPTHSETRDLSRSTSPATSSTRVRVHSGSPGVRGSVTDEVRLRRPSSDASNPPSPRGQKTGEWEIKSTSSTPSFSNHEESPSDTRPNSRIRMSPAVSTLELGQLVEEPSGDTQSPEQNQEVSLSCGVTTNPSMWVLPAEQGLAEQVRGSPLPKEVSEDERSSLHDASLPTAVSDADLSQRADVEKAPERGNEITDMEERGAPEGETESPPQSMEKPQWVELAEEVVRADPSLASVFYPLANRKTALMLMEQLLSEDTLLMEEHYKKKQEQRGPSESAETLEDGKPASCTSVLDSQVPQGPDQESNADVTEKKHLLVSFIEDRLRALEETGASLQAEILENASRGIAVLGLVRDRCPPVELERYNLFVGDLERVISLLLCLSARLARVQNALSTVDQHTDAEEKQSLDSRHHLLCKQREDAKDLKDNLDRRESLVATFLVRQLSAGELRDYRRFIQTKASLLIRQKDLEEKQRLGEEQLEALRSSLPP